MSVSNPKGFHWRRRVEFAETDMAGIAHFSSFVIYMEQAEHALLRSLGTSVFGAPVSAVAIEDHVCDSGGIRSIPHAGASSRRPHGESLSEGGPSRSAPPATMTWPRVHCECDYFAPARFEEELDIFVSVARLGEKSVTYLHRMFVGDREIAAGKIVAVCSMVNPDSGVLTGIRIPEHLRKLLAEYLTEPKQVTPS